MGRTFDVIVVGSGAGGACIAYELAKRGKDVLVLEAGPDVDSRSLGKFLPAAMNPGYYNRMAIFSRSVEGSIIYHTANLGGSTVFACGNMTRNPEIEDRFSHDFGMTNLSACFDEAEEEASVKALPMQMMSPGSRRLAAAAAALGFAANPASKGFVEGKTCDACGNCVFGCPGGAKWDSRHYLASFSETNGSLRTKTRVEGITLDGNKVTGVVAKGKDGREHVRSEVVVLAAGAINTPMLLQKAGIQSGSGLFVDYFSCTYGAVADADQLRGRSMATIIDQFHQRGFILSPFVDDLFQYLLFCPPTWHLRRGFSRRHTLGLMVKIADERSGKVAVDGRIYKRPTRSDRDRMSGGVEVATAILKQAGARDLVTTKVWRGAHPGGTAAIGEVIDNELRVKGVDGLYVCDASIFPFAPGLPPILTITAVGKWLGKRI